MAKFPWKKGERKPEYDDLALEMNRRFNKDNPGNVRYTPPTTAKPKPKIRVVGRTGFK